jgi:hypothetical protein
MLVGVPGVSRLLIRSFLNDRDLRWLGVSGQLQHATTSWAGSSKYTLAQMLPAGSNPPVKPVFVKLMKESPASRLAAYLLKNASPTTIVAVAVFPVPPSMEVTVTLLTATVS